MKDQLKTGTFDRSLIMKKYKDDFFNSNIHVDAHTKLDRLCFWEPGEYKLTLRVYTSKPNQTFEKTWKFNLSENGVKIVRLNTIKILEDICSIESYLSYNFTYAQYEDMK